MKRFFLFALILALLVPSIAACGERDGNEDITVVTTVFPEYDWTRNIIGDTEGIRLILLTENGTDLHSYQPTVSDIAAISECDVLICAGGASDAWIEDALALSPDSKRVVIRLISLLSEEEKLTEQALHHNAQHDDHNHHEHDHEHEYDEHVWLSLRHAAEFCRAIAEALGQKIPQNKDVYEENCRKYAEELMALDAAYRDAVSFSAEPTLLFADRFPFSYLMNDYRIECYAAFPGCSSETEASFKTVTYLAALVDDINLSSVIVLENTELRLAETVIASTKEKDARIVRMDSMQSISQNDIKQGVTYLEIMKNNLEALSLALYGSDEE